MKKRVLMFFLGYCVLQVYGQIGVTSCTQETAANCPNFLPNSYCNTDNDDLNGPFCECLAGYVPVANNISCEYECGGLTDPDNGIVTTNDGTRQGNVYSCVSTYKVVGTATRTCVQDSGWDGAKPTCGPAEIGDDCSANISQCNNIANGICQVTCQCNDGYVDDGTGLACAEASQIVICETDTDNRGTGWNSTLANKIVNITCDEGFTGQISRECLSDGNWRLPVYACVRAAVQNIENVVDTLSTDTSPETFSVILNDIQSTTTTTTNVTEKITNGEMKILTTSLKTIATLLPDELVADNTVLDNFFKSVGNLIDNSNDDTWQSEPDSTSAIELVSAVDNIAETLSGNLEPGEKRNITNDNVALMAQTLSENKIVYPDESVHLNWLRESKSKIELKPQTFNDPIVATAVVYKNLNGILPSIYYENSDKAEEGRVEKSINGPILAMTIPTRQSEELRYPISITFEHFDENLEDPFCAYLSYQSDPQGFWSGDGCEVVSSGNDVTVCECKHLTNFAVLMSPLKQADESSNWKLRIISIVCLSFSIICLVATIVLHFIFWKQLRNERSTLTIHLCFGLLISYLVFLIGVNRTKRKALCTAIAVFLHYIFLVVFGIMFVQGIQIAKAVLYVFKTKSNLKLLLVAAWGIPVVVVGISMFASQLKGYGDKNLCWLTSKNGLIWSFTGPAAAVTIFNTICLCLVIRAVFRTRVMKIKPVGKKVKTSIWATLVMLPILGITWIIGMFYMDDTTQFFQYIFAILNGLQGFFIFLFHCVLNKQVKRAMGVQQTKVSSKKFTQEVVM